MALIDSGDAGAAAADVVEYRFCHFEPDAQTLQACRDRPAQIVNAPRREARTTGIRHGPIEGRLGF
jgi:hypothetical protein